MFAAGSKARSPPARLLSAVSAVTGMPLPPPLKDSAEASSSSQAVASVECDVQEPHFPQADTIDRDVAIALSAQLNSTRTPSPLPPLPIAGHPSLSASLRNTQAADDPSIASDYGEPHFPQSEAIDRDVAIALSARLNSPSALSPLPNPPPLAGTASDLAVDLVTPPDAPHASPVEELQFKSDSDMAAALQLQLDHGSPPPNEWPPTPTIDTPIARQLDGLAITPLCSPPHIPAADGTAPAPMPPCVMWIAVCRSERSPPS